jgi:hypothetical protein
VTRSHTSQLLENLGTPVSRKRCVLEQKLCFHRRVDTSVRLHRRVDWPSFISLANIHFRSSSALLHKVASLSAHRSATFAQIRPKLGMTHASITTLERTRNVERVTTAREDGDDQKHRKTQKVAMSIFFKTEATLDLTLKRCMSDKKCVLSTNRKSWSNYQLVLLLPV